MANGYFDGGNSSDDDDEYKVPGISPEELAALEDERTIFEETEVQMASRIMRNHLVGAVHTMSRLALHSSNERVRMAAAQYIIERNMGRTQDNAPAPVDDPIQALLADVVSELDPEQIKALQVSGDFKGDN